MGNHYLSEAIPVPDDDLASFDLFEKNVRVKMV